MQIYLDSDYIDGSAVLHNFTATVSFEGPSGWRFDQTVRASGYDPVHGNIGDILEFDDSTPRALDTGNSVRMTLVMAR